MNNLPPMPKMMDLVFLVKRNGGIRIGRFGFSILSFLLHAIAPLLRKDYYNTACILGIDACLYMAIHMLLQLVLNINPAMTFDFSYFIGSVTWGFFYNNMYIAHLVKIGYKAVDKNSQSTIQKHHIKCEVTDLTSEEINRQSPI